MSANYRMQPHMEPVDVLKIPARLRELIVRDLCGIFHSGKFTVATIIIQDYITFFSRIQNSMKLMIPTHKEVTDIVRAITNDRVSHGYHEY